MEIYIFKGPQGVLMSPKVWKELIQLVSAGHLCQPFAGQGSHRGWVPCLGYSWALQQACGLQDLGFSLWSPDPQVASRLHLAWASSQASAPLLPGPHLTALSCPSPLPLSPATR